HANYAFFQAGRYKFTQPVSPQGIIDKMVKGDIFIPIVLQVTIPEGFRLKKINDRLAVNGVAHIKVLSNLVVDKAFISSLGLDAPSLEGYVYPATYNFSQMPSATDFYHKAVETFWQNLPPNYATLVKARGLTLHQAVTFASLIELETLHEEEKPKVSE